MKFLVSFLLVLGLILVGGCAQQGPGDITPPPEQESMAPPPETSPQPPPAMERTRGSNPFLTGPPELKECLRQELGEEAFNALSAKERVPEPEEAALVKSCLEQFRSPIEEPGPRWMPGGVAVPGRYADAEVVEMGEGEYRMYFGEEPEVAAGAPGIYSAVSGDGIKWEVEEGVRLASAVFPDVVRLPQGGYRMYFQREGVIRSAVSEDGLTWRVEAGVRIGKGGHDNLDDQGIGSPATILLPDGTYMMVYHTEKGKRFCDRSPNPSTQFLFYATSKDGLDFEKRGMVLDSRDDVFCDLVTGPELVWWDDGRVHLFFWSHRGIYESIYEDGKFSEPKLVYKTLPGGRPPGDPTLMKIKGRWFMYYGQHTEGIFYATYGKP